MTVRADVDTLVEEVHHIAIEGVLLGNGNDSWPEVRRVSLDLLDTAKALPPADREAAADLISIARTISSAGWKAMTRDPRLRTNAGDPRIQTKLLVGLRGR